MNKYTYQVAGGGKTAQFEAYSVYDALEQWLVIHPNIPPESAIKAEIQGVEACPCPFCASDDAIWRVI